MKIQSLALIACVVLAQGCSKLWAPKNNPVREPSVSQVVPGELLVVTRDSKTVDELRSKYQVETLDAELGAYRLRGEALRGNEKQAAEELEKSGKFDLVERNLRVQATEVTQSIPRDPKWLELWAMRNYGQDSPNGTEGAQGSDIHALQAWAITKGSRELLVGVVDTGVDYTHPDLKDNIWINEKENNGIPGVDDDSNGYTDDVYGWDFVSGTREKPYYGQLGDPDPMDDHGHGTHVSGTIGASGDNGIGVVGINWKVRIMGLKFLSAEGSGTSADEFRAIRYATQMGVDVINASYGGGAPSKLVEQAIKLAGDKGLLFVAAAGNDSTNSDQTPSYPANYELDNVVSVAATDNRDQLAGFSNYGYLTVDIAAPGVGITSTHPLQLPGDSAPDANPYRSWSGTSMATPHVVGAAALVLSAAPELRKKPAELKKRLLETTDWMPQLAGRVASGGRLNLLKAVKGERDNTVTLAGWVETPYNLTTPRNPTELMDQTWKITVPGAKAIRIHVAEALVDGQFDVAMVYDSLFRPIAGVPDMALDHWMPAVMGDTMYLKFSNALVAIQKTQKKKFKTTDEVDWNVYSFCQQLEDGWWECTGFQPPGPSFANFGSDGIQIDRISYVPADVQ